MVDPFEEFEFKPLTEGLGFHKKKPAAQNFGLEIENKNPLEAQDLHTMQSSEMNLTPEPMSTPLPRQKNRIETPTVDNSKSAVDEILNTLNKRRLDIDFDANNKVSLKSTIKQSKPTTYVKTTISYSAAFLDGMLVIAASLLCMIALLLITKADLVGNLSNPDDEGMIYLSTFCVFAGVTFIYLLVNRAFTGYTPGEWAFDLRLGTPEEAQKPVYILKVMARSFLQIATGFILLPIISTLFKKDLAGELTGASLMKRA